MNSSLLYMKPLIWFHTPKSLVDLHVSNKGGVLYHYICLKKRCVSSVLFYQGFSCVVIGIWGWPWESLELKFYIIFFFSQTRVLAKTMLAFTFIVSKCPKLDIYFCFSYSFFHKIMISPRISPTVYSCFESTVCKYMFFSSFFLQRKIGLDD